MSYIVCIVSAAPLRKEPTHSSEMVSQLLFGEFAEELELTGDFIRVRCLYDNYEGWCQRKQLTETQNIMTTNKFLSHAIGMVKVNNMDCRISIGSPIYEDIVNFKNIKVEYGSITGSVSESNEFTAQTITAKAFEYINTPYLWGGKSVFGIDCSGFTQQLFKLFGILLPRDAYQQAESGELVGFLQQAQCGDLAFFDNSEGAITHVGILLNSEQIIHSSGKVRIDKIDNAGIVNVDTGERTHHFRIIKRYRELTT